jgi:protease I
MSKKRILMIVGDYTEDYEVMVPFQALQMMGHIVHVVCPNREDGEQIITAIHDFGDEDTFSEKRGHNFTLNETFDNIDVDDYDALILPGGRAPEYLRLQEEVIEIVQQFNDVNKPIAAICHGPQILISANVIGGKKCTGYPSLEDDIENAGGEWIDIDIDDALVDDNLITAQAWTAHPEWLAKFLEILGTKIET